MGCLLLGSPGAGRGAQQTDKVLRVEGCWPAAPVRVWDAAGHHPCWPPRHPGRGDGNCCLCWTNTPCTAITLRCGWPGVVVGQCLPVTNTAVLWLAGNSNSFWEEPLGRDLTTVPPRGCRSPCRGVLWDSPGCLDRSFPTLTKSIQQMHIMCLAAGMVWQGGAGCEQEVMPGCAGTAGQPRAVPEPRQHFQRWLLWLHRQLPRSRLWETLSSISQVLSRREHMAVYFSDNCGPLLFLFETISFTN